MTLPFSVVSFAGQGRHIDVFGGIELRIPSASTGGNLSVWEANAAPNEGPPMHVHGREDELFYVLEGTFQFWCGGETFIGGPGTVAMLPRNVPHTYRSVGTAPGRFLGAAMPGGFEGFFLEVERKGATDPASLSAIAAGFGLRFVAAEAANDESVAGNELSREELLVTSA